MHFLDTLANFHFADVTISRRIERNTADPSMGSAPYPRSEFAARFA
jgi:hypothetical protein